MGRVLTWVAFVIFVLCMVGMVAWPLWSESDLWAFVFAAIGIAVLFPVILIPRIRSLRKVFSSSDPH